VRLSGARGEQVNLPVINHLLAVAVALVTCVNPCLCYGLPGLDLAVTFALLPSGGLAGDITPKVLDASSPRQKFFTLPIFWLNFSGHPFFRQIFQACHVHY
jgi:hypothetical protein